MPSISQYSRQPAPTTRPSLRVRVDVVLFVHACLVLSAASILTTIMQGWFLVVSCVIVATVLSLLGSLAIGYVLRRTISTTHHGRIH